MPCRAVACLWQRTLLTSCMNLLFALKYLYQVSKFCLSFVKSWIKCKSWDWCISVPVLDTRAGFMYHFIISAILAMVFTFSFSGPVYIFEVYIFLFSNLILFILLQCEWMFESFKCKFDYKEVVEKIGMVELKKVRVEPKQYSNFLVFPFYFLLNFTITLSCRFYPFSV